MSKKWSIAQAKAQLSRVVADSRQEVQVIENRGVEAAVLIDPTTYRRMLQLAEQSAPAERLRQFVALSRQLGARGGVELEPPRRSSRPSPFSKSRG